MITDRTLRVWMKERDEVVTSLNYERYKMFFFKWVRKGMYDIGLWPGDKIAEISMYKMALDLESVPLDVKNRAISWLEEHGCKRK